MVNLRRLLATDLSKADRERLIQGVIDAELAYDKAQEWSGRLIAALKRHHSLSWPVLARLTGVPQPTLIRRAKPFL